MKAIITKRRVDAMKPGDLIADYGQESVSGFVARCLPSGKVTYGFRYRDKTTRERRWMRLGLHGSITPDEARRRAKVEAGKVAEGKDPVLDLEAARLAAQRAREANARTVAWLLDEFMSRYVRRRGLRSADEIERVFARYVRPRIGAVSIYSLRRSQVVKMLDEIEDEHGPVMADRTLAHVRKAFAWQAARDDEFNSPIVRGMARTKPKERERTRILADDELRDLWAALDKLKGPYPAFVRVLLLTAQRRDEVAGMRRREIAKDVWTIPAERYKTKADLLVPLTKPALQLIEAQPVRLDSKDKPDRERDFIFGRSGAKPFGGFSKCKRALDDELAAIRKSENRDPMAPWVLHDLRRTARSLMSRAGVSADVAERVLGHVVSGVRGVYDRHDFLAEKRDALDRLGKVIESIVNPPDSCNVVALRAAAGS